MKAVGFRISEGPEVSLRDVMVLRHGHSGVSTSHPRAYLGKSRDHWRERDDLDIAADGVLRKGFAAHIPLRFARRLSLIPALRVNLSKRGASLSVGHRGA